MVQGPVSNRRFSRRAVRSAILVASGVVAVIIVITGGLYLFNSMSESALEAEKQEREARAKELGAEVSKPFNAIAAQLSALAKDEAIISLFEQGDAVMLAAEGGRVASRFEAALSMRMLLPGSFEQDNSSTSPLSFASIDLLSRAKTSKGKVASEVHFFGAENQHIVMVERVQNATGQLIGLLHLSLDTGLFEQAISTLPVTAAYVELRQEGDPRPLVLAKHGQSALGSGTPVISSITGTRWNLAYWQGGTAVDGATAGAGFGLTPILLLLVFVFAAIAYFLMRRSKSAAESDGALSQEDIVYGGAVQAIMDGLHPGFEKLIPNLPEGTRSNASLDNDITMPSAIISQGNAIPNSPSMILSKGGESTPRHWL